MPYLASGTNLDDTTWPPSVADDVAFSLHRAQPALGDLPSSSPSVSTESQKPSTFFRFACLPGIRDTLVPHLVAHWRGHYKPRLAAIRTRAIHILFMAEATTLNTYTSTTSWHRLSMHGKAPPPPRSTRSRGCVHEPPWLDAHGVDA